MYIVLSYIMGILYVCLTTKGQNTQNVPILISLAVLSCFCFSISFFSKWQVQLLSLSILINNIVALSIFNGKLEICTFASHLIISTYFLQEMKVSKWILVIQLTAFLIINIVLIIQRNDKLEANILCTIFQSLLLILFSLHLKIKRNQDGSQNQQEYFKHFETFQDGIIIIQNKEIIFVN